MGHNSITAVIIVVSTACSTPVEPGDQDQSQANISEPTPAPIVPTNGTDLNWRTFLYSIDELVVADVIDLSTGEAIGKTGESLAVKLTPTVSYGLGSVGTWTSDGALPIFSYPLAEGGESIDWVTPAIAQAELEAVVDGTVDRHGNRYFDHELLECAITYQVIDPITLGEGPVLTTDSTRIFDATVRDGDQLVVSVAEDAHFGYYDGDVWVSNLIVDKSQIVTIQDGYFVWESWVSETGIYFALRAEANYDLFSYDCEPPLSR